MQVLIAITALVLLLLGLLHFYWAIGGKRMYITVLPKKHDGKLLFKPGMMSSLVVGLGLIFLAIITFGNSGFFRNISTAYFRYGSLGISMIFLARVIGDFNYMGISKRVKGTTFAANDAKYFIPVCLLISICSFLIFLF